MSHCCYGVSPVNYPEPDPDPVLVITKLRPVQDGIRANHTSTKMQETYKTHIIYTAENSNVGSLTI